VHALAPVIHVKLQFEWRWTREEITNPDLRTVISSANDLAERGSTIAALEVV